ncbi:Sodium/potassium/calcium exchanger 5 [Gryllus bimaculatus]|nr:Sodium/potassium/calcium exchanger 5 [Gryllus bimaculatus]
MRRRGVCAGEPPNCTPPAIDDFPHDLLSEQQRRDGAVVLHVLVSLYLFVALAVVCDRYFVPAVERICQALNMSNDVAGATFMAAATSAPELFVNVIGTFITEGDIGVGTIVGSAVFNILAVAACCGIGAGISYLLEKNEKELEISHRYLSRIICGLLAFMIAALVQIGQKLAIPRIQRECVAPSAGAGWPGPLAPPQLAAPRRAALRLEWSDLRRTRRLPALLGPSNWRQFQPAPPGIPAWAAAPHRSASLRAAPRRHTPSDAGRAATRADRYSPLSTLLLIQNKHGN